MRLDLSKFKKVQEDQKCTTLQHPSGHQIKIASGKLSPGLKKELDSLPVHKAFGGPLEPKSSPHSRASKPSVPRGMPQPKEASHAYTEPDDGGTDVVLAALNRKLPPFGPLGAEKPHYPPCINPSCKSYGHSHPNCRCYGGQSEHTGSGEAGHFAQGGEVNDKYFCNDARAHFKDCEYYSDGGQAPKPDPTPVPKAPPTDPQQTSLAQQSMRKAFNYAYGSPAGVPEQAPADPDTGSDMQVNITPQDMAANASENPDNAPQQPPQAADDQAPEAPEDQSQQPQQPEVAQAPQSPVDQVMQTKGDNLDKLMTESQGFNNDLQNGHIKPETYHDLFEKRSTLGKIGTLFGLLIGGAGSGLAHQPNVVLGMMNNEIMNDLHAQETSASNKQNFLKINMSNLMNQATMKQMGFQNQQTQAQTGLIGQQAKALSITNMQVAALHNLVLKTQSLPPGPQRDQAMQTLAMMNEEVQKGNYGILDKAATASAMAGYLSGQSSGSQTMSKNGEGSYSSSSKGPNTMLLKSGLAGPAAQKVGQDIEEKTIDNVPSVAGQKASRPIPQDKRDQVQSMNVLDDKAKDLINYAKAHEGSWNPQTRAIAQQKANEMVGFYSSSLGTSMTEGNRTWLDEQIAKKNPTSAIAQELMGSNSKLQEIQNSNNMRRNNMLKSLGFHPKQSAQSADASPYEGKTATNSKGEKLIMKNGKWTPHG